MSKDAGLERFAEQVIKRLVDMGVIKDRPGKPTVNLSQDPPHEEILRWVEHDEQ